MKEISLSIIYKSFIAASFRYYFVGNSINNQVLLAEGTPRTVWHGDHWQYDVINQGLDEPIILSPQKIHHVTPQSRIIGIMRNPTSRLISDYKYYVRVGRDVDGTDFHDKVLLCSNNLIDGSISKRISFY